MKKYILQILLLSFCLLTQYSFGQKDTTSKNPSDKDLKKLSKALTKDSNDVKIPLKFQGLRLGFDITRPIGAILEDNAFALEFNADFLLNRVYYLTADVGWQNIERQDKAQSFIYQNQGFYTRLGIQKNYAKEAKINQVFFLGVHYGFALFEQNIQYQITPQNWNIFTSEKIENKNLQAHWLEISSGLKVPVLPKLYFSPLLRATVRVYSNSPEDLEVNEIPGIGLKKTIVRFRVGYQIMYQF